MSQENVELARRAFEAATRKPKPDFATVNALFHADHEFVSITSAVEGSSFRGARGFREWRNLIGEVMETDVEVERARELDQDRVLFTATLTVQGKGSGASYSDRRAFVMTVRDGKVVRTESYASPEDALAAAGLRE